MDLSAVTDRSGDDPAPSQPGRPAGPQHSADAPLGAAGSAARPATYPAADGPRHAAEPQPPDGDPIRWITAPAAPGRRRVRLTLGGAVALKPGAVLTSDGWAGATNRVDVDSVEGVGTLTVDTH